jgi:hypothetical protein
MILEICAIVFLIECTNMLAWLIGRQRDVFYYVAE